MIFLKKKTSKLLKLLDYVKSKHGEQLRKYTEDPYWYHLVRVANLTYVVDNSDVAQAIALCHDLFEDTDCTKQQLEIKLTILNFSKEEIQLIIQGVHELTDYFTKESFPNLNREVRKKLEAERLHGVFSLAQTIKYADLIDNCISIIKYDKNFAKVYLEEKKYILSGMNKGNFDLYLKACNSVYEGFKTIGNER